MESAAIHILKSLKLPDRYESLSEMVGPEVARILVAPEASVTRDLETAANSIRTRGEGFFGPILGKSGIGKTTFASSLSHFFPTDYAPTVSYTGRIDFDSLKDTVVSAEKSLAANDRRVIPLNLDHRESAPPSSEEIAHIKRFLRPPSRGARCLVLWPETNTDIASKIADDYKSIAGAVPITLPFIAAGPPIHAWRDVAVTTLEVANHVDSIGDLGVDPTGYDPTQYETLGGFLRAISNDFSRRLTELVASTRKPVSLTVVFACASPDAGVLSQLTAHGRYGLVDGHALLDATSESEIGRWWQARRGLLTQTVLRLNAHAFCLPPTAALAILRNLGDSDVQDFLEKQGIRRRGRAHVTRDLGRTDFGRFLRGELRSALEARGTPATTSTPAFNALADRGFTFGKDKSLNRSLGEAIRLYFTDAEVQCEEVQVEQCLDFCPLVPDNAVFYGDNVQCIEYTWRKGDFLASRTRSAVSQYILEKLRNFARELGWTGD